MARHKNESKRIHRKKIRKAKERLKLFLKGEFPKEKLTQLARHFLEKRERAQPKSL